MECVNVNRKTIEPIDGEFVFCHHGEYPHNSVLAGEPFRKRIAHHATLAEAVAAHPEAEVLDYDARDEPVEMSHVPPAWFDPDACGERWSEDD